MIFYKKPSVLFIRVQVWGLLTYIPQVATIDL